MNALRMRWSLLFLSVLAWGCSTSSPDTTARRGQPGSTYPLLSAVADETEYQENCGVNVAYLTLRYFRKSYDIQNFSRELNVGRSFEAHCAMNDLKHLFESQQLSVKAVKVEGTENIGGLVKSGEFVVSRMMWSQGGIEQAHFVGIIRDPSGELTIINPPDAPRRFSNGLEAQDAWFKASTGELLIVTDERPHVVDNAPVFLSDPQTDCGDVAATSDKVVAKLAYRNVGNATLNILSGLGPCSCFQGVTGDKVLAPGAAGTLIFTFDKARMPAGHLERDIVLKTNDPKRAEITIKVLMNVLEFSADKDVSLVPTSINLGRRAAGDISKRKVLIVLHLPSEVDGRPSKVSSIVDDKRLLLVQKNDTERREPSGSLTRDVSFTLEWATKPIGHFKENVAFTIEGRGNDITLNIPVEGDGLVDR